MYRELLPADHRRILAISEDEVPDVLLLLGVFDVYEGAARFARYLHDARYMRDGRKGLPSWLGTSHGLKVALAASFGGPMAATHAHTWLAAGTPVVVQLGWYGALQQGSSLGDVAVPRHAERQDGVSDWYLPKGILADATPELSAGIVANLKAAGVGVNEHAIYSTPALLAESREVIGDWSRHGYHGVDMETAATFAVAKSLGAKRAAALIRFDDLVNEEHSLAEELKAEHLGVLRQREPVVVESVLAAVASLTMPRG